MNRSGRRADAADHSFNADPRARGSALFSTFETLSTFEDPMKAFQTLLALSLCLCLVGCGPEDQTTGGSKSDDLASENHDHSQGHDHDDHDHGEHAHDSHGHDHDAKDKPNSLRDAASKIESMGDKIIAAFADETPNDAHEELHDIGHLIESLPVLATKVDLPDEQQAEVRDSTGALMDAFGELDASLHGGDEVDVDQVSAKISTELEKLQEML
ncbi:MAG: hypothetical protein AAGJ40_00675 [Planctomycetota bacterium]